MFRSLIVAALIPLALGASAGAARACDDVREGETRVLEDDTPECLSVSGLSEYYGGPGRLAMSNGCGYPITLRCASGDVCSEWADVAPDAPVVLAAGEARDVAVAQGVPGGAVALVWQGDGETGELVYGFVITGESLGGCGGLGDDQAFCAAAPGRGAGGGGWLLLGLLGGWILRRRGSRR